LRPPTPLTRDWSYRLFEDNDSDNFLWYRVGGSGIDGYLSLGGVRLVPGKEEFKQPWELPNWTPMVAVGLAALFLLRIVVFFRKLSEIKRLEESLA
jgi:hypothetical protein